MMNLLKQDIELLNQKGITEEMLRSQLSFFQKGIPPVVLAAPATTKLMGLWYLRYRKRKMRFLV